jgi:hypothetical protein
LFPAVLILALDGLRALTTRLSIFKWSLLSLPLLVLGVELWPDDRFFLPLRVQALLAALGLLAPAALLLVWQMSRPPRARHAGRAGSVQK